MSFYSGPAGFARFRVKSNDLIPGIAEPWMVEKLEENRFEERLVTSPDDAEVGWVAGDHLLDMRFSFEKNCYMDMVVASMRVDTHPVPGELRRAWKALSEQSIRQQQTRDSDEVPANLSRAQRAEAADLADQQMREELATGRFRRSKVVPVLWDLRRGWVLINHTGAQMGKSLQQLFLQTFDLELVPLTAGERAAEMLLAAGKRREHEDARPAAFAPKPETSSSEDDGRDPRVAPVSWAYPIEQKDFLGNEWLLWLWYMAQQSEGLATVNLESGRRQELELALWQAIDLECAWGVGGKLSMKSDSAAIAAESLLGLAKAKLPRKAGLMLADADDERVRFELTLQADRFQVTGAKLPPAEDASSEREQLENRLNALRDLCERLDGLLDAYLSLRFSPAWEGTRTKITRWIASPGKRAAATGQAVDGIATKAEADSDAPARSAAKEDHSLKIAR